MVTMLDSALGFITEAASNSLLIFCFCNLIIVMILFGSKPCSGFQQESESPTPEVITNTYEYSPTIMDFEEQSIPQGQEAPADDSEEDRTEDCSTREEEEEKAEEEDELRRRVEEFIEKVNKGWRAELLRNSRLVKA